MHDRSISRQGPSNPIRSIIQATAAVILAMVSIQAGAAYAKTLFSTVGPQGATALRTCFAALLLAAVWKPWRGRLTMRQTRMVLAYGTTLGTMNLLFYFALRTLPLGIAVAVEFIGPFTLALLSSRRISDIVWLGFAVIGLIVLIPLGKLSAATDPLGILFALAAGGCWALYIVFGRKVGAVLPSGRATALGLATAAMVTLPFGVVHAGWALLSPAILVSAFAVAILSSALPYSLEMTALKRLPTRTFGVLMSLEPALAAMAGGLFLGESLSLSQSAGIACIILASLGSTVSARSVSAP